ncbi:MAG TPA: hypothetical protein VMB51_12945 [Solirubrobacteraceae bacterium]|nr:hypothetical protein [Solirubrobacteraceae bacterium]
MRRSLIAGRARRRRGTRSVVGCAALLAALCACSPAPAHAGVATTATIAASLAPDRLGAKAALTLAVHYAGGEAGVPAPVRRAVVWLPAGMSLDAPQLRSCSAARLRAVGAGGCPQASALGAGHALVETRAGSLTVTEKVSLRAFIGPLDNLEPTFEILAQGLSPAEQRVVLSGFALVAGPPYGEQLVLSIPPVPTLPLAPDASIASLSLTVGAGLRARARDRNAVLVPSACPAGGFPVAAEFTYAGAPSGEASTAIPCPR